MESQYIELLDTMLQDMEHAPPIYQPTPFWHHAVKEITQDIRLNGIESFKSLTSSTTYFVPAYGYYLSPDSHEEVNKVIQKNCIDAPKLLTRLQRLFSGEMHAYADYRTFLASSSDTPPHTPI